MRLDDIKSPITSLSGIGQAQEKLFAKLNIFTVGDLLKFYPKSYEDRRKKNPLSNFMNEKVHTIAKVISHEWFGYGAMKTLKMKICDETSDAELICFNRPFLQKNYPSGSIIALTGQFQLKYGELQCSAFEAIKLSEHGLLEEFKDAPLPDSVIFPIYALTKGLSQTAVRKAVKQALTKYNKGIESEVPPEIEKKRNLLSKTDSLKYIHMPTEIAQIQSTRESLAYEELFNFQRSMAERAYKHKGQVPDAALNFSEDSSDFFKKAELQNQNGIDNTLFVENLSPLQKELMQKLDFSLTEDQKYVISQMNRDIDKGYIERNRLIQGKETEKVPFTMQRLLQGDVGSGKTLAAFFACLRIINWSGQCAIMAPTEILARQHAENAAVLLVPLGIKVAFLTGNIKTSGRTALLRELKEGGIDIVIGTHALFSKDVIYKDLQLAVIDEQHRFGVIQRESIVNKGRLNENSKGAPSPYEPHLLMMSATPIPQTLALTVFGDLDVSTIKTMPKGRKPVQTYLVREGHETNAYEAVRRELKAGRQAYFVYPAIENADRETEIKNVQDAFKKLSGTIYKEFRTAILHSKIDEEEQIRTLKEFKEGKIQVLAATTVIEVGVDIPNATSIVIEQADRFGLAQLHQLRGRVGRGAEQSFCYLIYSKKITENGIERMKVLRQNTDGFIIAEKDLELRGPGEINGTAQAGILELGIADLERDKKILEKARYDAFDFVRNLHKEHTPTQRTRTIYPHGGADEAEQEPYSQSDEPFPL